MSFFNKYPYNTNTITNKQQITEIDLKNSKLKTTINSDIYQDQDNNIKVKSYTGDVDVQQILPQVYTKTEIDQLQQQQNSVLQAYQQLIDQNQDNNLIQQVQNLQNTLNNKTDIGHQHTVSDITNLQTTLDSKVNEVVYQIDKTTLTNEITNTNNNLTNNYYTKDQINLKEGLQDIQLSNKTDIGHNHQISDITNLQIVLDSKVNDSVYQIDKTNFTNEITNTNNNLANNYYTKTQIDNNEQIELALQQAIDNIQDGIINNKLNTQTYNEFLTEYQTEQETQNNNITALQSEQTTQNNNIITLQNELNTHNHDINSITHNGLLINSLVATDGNNIIVTTRDVQGFIANQSLNISKLTYNGQHDNKILMMIGNAIQGSYLNDVKIVLINGPNSNTSYMLFMNDQQKLQHSRNIDQHIDLESIQINKIINLQNELNNRLLVSVFNNFINTYRKQNTIQYQDGTSVNSFLFDHTNRKIIFQNFIGENNLQIQGILNSELLIQSLIPADIGNQYLMQFFNNQIGSYYQFNGSNKGSIICNNIGQMTISGGAGTSLTIAQPQLTISSTTQTHSGTTFQVQNTTSTFSGTTLNINNTNFNVNTATMNANNINCNVIDCINTSNRHILLDPFNSTGPISLLYYTETSNLYCYNRMRAQDMQIGVFHNNTATYMMQIYDRGASCIALNHNTNSWVNVSDRNLKTNFRLFDNQYYSNNLQQWLSLPYQFYRYKKDVKQSSFGLIAQDIEPLTYFQNCVGISENENGEQNLMLDNNLFQQKINALIQNFIKEQQKINEKQEQHNIDVEAVIQELKNQDIQFINEQNDIVNNDIITDLQNQNNLKTQQIEILNNKITLLQNEVKYEKQLNLSQQTTINKHSDTIMMLLDRIEALELKIK